MKHAVNACIGKKFTNISLEYAFTFAVAGVPTYTVEAEY